MVNHYEVYIIFQDIEHQLQENILLTFFIIVFCEISIKLRSIFYPIKIIYWKHLRHCPTIQTTLFGETFVNFAIFGFFAKVRLAKSSKNCNS